MREQLITRRNFLKAGGLLGIAVLVEACGGNTTIVKVSQERKYEELGLNKDVSLIDIRTIPGYDNAPGGFVIYDETVNTPEPFSKEVIVRKIKFAWQANVYDSQIAISEVPIDKVQIISDYSITDAPSANFNLLYNFSKVPNNPAEIVNRQLNTATFYISPEDIREFRGDQILY